jgi:hypothetical protein
MNLVSIVVGLWSLLGSLFLRIATQIINQLDIKQSKWFLFCARFVLGSTLFRIVFLDQHYA